MDGLQLKAARKNLGYTQVQLAAALHLSMTSIARYEMPSNTGTFPIPYWVDMVIALWLKERAVLAQAVIREIRDAEARVLEEVGQQCNVILDLHNTKEIL